MKRILAGLSLLFCVGTAYALSDVWKSSFTATADTNKNVCMDSRGILHGVIVSSSAGGNFAVYASSAVQSSTMTAINTGANGTYYFDVQASTNTGLTYNKTGTASVTLIYSCH